MLLKIGEYDKGVFKYRTHPIGLEFLVRFRIGDIDVLDIKLCYIILSTDAGWYLLIRLFLCFEIINIEKYICCNL